MAEDRREGDVKLDRLAEDTQVAIEVEAIQNPKNGDRLATIEKEVVQIQKGQEKIIVRRRRADDHRVDALIVEVAAIRQRQVELAEQMVFNTEVLDLIKKNTSDIVEVWKAIEGGVKVLGWIGVIAKWVSIVAGCVAAVSAAFFAMTHWGGDISPK